MTEIDMSAERKRGYLAGVANAGVVLFAIALCALVYLTPLRNWLTEGQVIKHELATFGLAAPLVFAACCAFLVAIGVPRLLLCSLGGMIFGFAWGLLWTQIGTVLGAYATFLFVRWRGRVHTLQQFPKLRGLSQRLRGNGLVAVLVVRQLPVNGLTNGLLLGLSPVSHRDFLIGTFLGFLPQGIAACLIGAGLIHADMTRDVGYLALGVATSVLLAFGLKRFVAARNSSKMA
ncbi:MAG: hypothetical protein H6R26_3129 [Proteobacteria bacterium]|nr:hypothetical protein [Pseudomonadota bacterium]